MNEQNDNKKKPEEQKGTWSPLAIVAILLFQIAGGIREDLVRHGTLLLGLFWQVERELLIISFSWEKVASF